MIKSLITEAALLAHPRPNAAFCVMTDALDVVVGGVLHERFGGHSEPPELFSEKLAPPEAKLRYFRLRITWRREFPIRSL